MKLAVVSKKRLKQDQWGAGDWPSWGGSGGVWHDGRSIREGKKHRDWKLIFEVELADELAMGSEGRKTSRIDLRSWVDGGTITMWGLVWIWRENQEFVFGLGRFQILRDILRPFCALGPEDVPRGQDRQCDLPSWRLAGGEEKLDSMREAHGISEGTRVRQGGRPEGGRACREARFKGKWPPGSAGTATLKQRPQVEEVGRRGECGEAGGSFQG